MGTIPTIYSIIDGFSLCHSSDSPVREHVEQTQATHVAYQHGEVDEPRDADGEMICVPPPPPPNRPTNGLTSIFINAAGGQCPPGASASVVASALRLLCRVPWCLLADVT